MTSLSPPTHGGLDSGLAAGQWLRQYLAGDQTAFENLVRHYLPLVMAAALRRTGGNHILAEEAVQLTFIDLARRAPSLKPDATLGGWLHARSRFAAADVMKAESRRTLRESQAAAMIWNLSDHTAPSQTQGWRECQSEVDASLDRLSVADRTAVLMRFAEGHDLATVAQAMGCSVEAARKRVHRSLEKLRRLLTHRFPAATLTLVAVGLASDHAQAASAAVLAKPLATNALAKAGPLSPWAKLLPKVKAATLGASAACCVWAWPIGMRLQSQRLAEISGQDAPGNLIAAKPASAPVFPAFPQQRPLHPGMSVAEVVRQMAAMAEGPDFSEARERLRFLQDQLTVNQYPEAIQKLHTMVSPGGWHAFLKRSLAGDFFIPWVRQDAVAALQFVMNFDEREHTNSLESADGMDLISIVWSSVSYLNEEDTQQSAATVKWCLEVLKKDSTNYPDRVQSMVMRGIDWLTRMALNSGDLTAVSNLIDLVNEHGFNWLDSAGGKVSDVTLLTKLMTLVPTLESPAHRYKMEDSIIRRLGNVDLPTAKNYVQSITNPDKRWQLATALAIPDSYSMDKHGHGIVREELKPLADWLLGIAEPAERNQAIERTARYWDFFDPDWAIRWHAQQVGQQQASAFWGSIASEFGWNVATFGKDPRGKEFAQRIGVLKKFDPAAYQIWRSAELEKYANHHQDLEEMLAP